MQENNIEKTKILIWGAGYMGRRLIPVIEENSNLCIFGFGDNDVSKIGNELIGYIVYSIDEIIKIQDEIDCIVISIVDNVTVYKQLIGVKELKLPIYLNYSELIDRRFSIDISGWCNAKCKYCYTGRKNKYGNNVTSNKKYMDFEMFSRIHQHLLEKRILHPFNEVMLYSWGEPFLNKDYLKIVDYLSDNNQIFSISTNASQPKLSNNPKTYSTCKTIVFSLSGISKTSYEKIHGFNIEVIKSNIKKILDNAKACGFKGEAKLSFHVYRFNKAELERAKSFAENNDIVFEPIDAYLASWSLLRNYLKNEMDSNLKNEIDTELYVDDINKAKSCRPVSYKCPLENIVSIGVNGDIELCCCSDLDTPNFLWKSIFEIKSDYEWKAYRKKMMSSESCIECRKLGIDYIIGGGL